MAWNTKESSQTMGIFTKVFGDPNERDLKRIRPIVARINALEDEMRALADEDLRGMTAEFKQELDNGATLDDILPEAFAVAREAGRRVLNMRHFDVQLIGGIVLHQGKIAEMRTGEGKTLVATLPSYLNALTGKGVHVVTVNDYLARRDRDWMGRLHEFLGLTVGVVTSSGGADPHTPERRAAYAADITYATNNELGFDYLRDHMMPDLSYCSQRELNYAIVDEVDNILIDEARTPLIISGQAEESVELYQRFARLAPLLKRDQDYIVDEKDRDVSITDEGIDKVERLLHVANIYDDMELTRHLVNALKAHALFKRDKDYIVRDNEVLIVDEFTGRVLSGRRYSEGLHQALEAKENVKIQNENRTMATITYQNFFRLYSKLAGMTGTALTEAEEFNKIYKLDVIVIPTNRPIKRADQPDFIYGTEAGKFTAVVQEIAERHEAGQPVLVGTTSVEISEHLSRLLDEQNIPHNVLNAKQHEREAHVVAQAGRSGAVTIATNMAGRGTDIVLGGSPDEYVEQILREQDIDPEFATDEDREEARAEAKKLTDEDRERVLAAGGLYIIGTERHESRRIDNQLRGRAGRQGDPGESRFFISLEDELMRRFGGDRVKAIMSRFLDEDLPIENKMVTGMLEQAQTKVEAFNFDIRKNVVEYDDVIAAQRKVIYEDRQAILERADMHDRIIQIIERESRRIAEQFTRGNLPENWDLDGLNNQLATWGAGIPEDIIPDDLNRLRRETLINAVIAEVVAQYESKEAVLAEEAKALGLELDAAEQMRQFERQSLLMVVDTLWRDHIDHLDVLRSGIGLRSMAQRDPLVEFKREAFESFERLIAEIEHYTAERLMHMQVHITQAEPQPPQQIAPPRKGKNGKAPARQMKPLASRPAAPAPQQASPKALPAPAGSANGANGRVAPKPAHGNGANKPANANAANGSGARPAPALAAKGVAVGKPNGANTATSGARPANGVASGQRPANGTNGANGASGHAKGGKSQALPGRRRR